ncbi:MAG: hypothetical protein FK730_01115 [Asgard group archaeon]|nr:hypothetical protein [Asgard group archaeon]
MKKRLLDVLVCPYDKATPLKLYIFKKKTLQEVILPKASENTKVVCQYYCGKKNLRLIDEDEKQSKVIAKNIKKISYDTDCHDCFKTEIVAGILECPKCETIYPINEDIPIMTKPELRNEEIEKQFTEKWSEKIKKIYKKS